MLEVFNGLTGAVVIDGTNIEVGGGNTTKIKTILDDVGTPVFIRS